VWVGGNLKDVQTMMVASDLPITRAEVAGTVSRPDLAVIEVESGQELLARVRETMPDLVVVDMQMGNMGGMAVCHELLLEASYGSLESVPVLMLLDRRPDVFLARRSGADGWLVKPLDPIRLRRAVDALLAGGTFHDESYRPMSVPSPALGDAPSQMS
jgi:DNA-binding response OmpR family regulator